MKNKVFKMIKSLLVFSLLLTNLVFVPRNILASEDNPIGENEEVDPTYLVPSDPGPGGNGSIYRTITTGFRCVTVTYRITEGDETYTETVSYMDTKELNYFLRHCLIDDTEVAMKDAFGSLFYEIIAVCIGGAAGAAMTLFSMLIGALSLGTTIETEKFYEDAVAIADKDGKAIITLRDAYKKAEEWTSNIYSYKSGTINGKTYKYEIAEYK